MGSRGAVLPAGFGHVERDVLDQLRQMQTSVAATPTAPKSLPTEKLLGQLMQSSSAEDAARIVRDAMAAGLGEGSKGAAGEAEARAARSREAGASGAGAGAGAASAVPLHHPYWAQLGLESPDVRDYHFTDVSTQPGQAWPAVQFEPPPGPTLTPYSCAMEFLERGDVASYAMFQKYSYPATWSEQVPEEPPSKPIRLTRWRAEQALLDTVTLAQQRALEEQRAHSARLQETLAKWRQHRSRAAPGDAPGEASAHEPRRVEVKRSKQYLRGVDVLERHAQRRGGGASGA